MKRLCYIYPSRRSPGIAIKIQGQVKALQKKYRVTLVQHHYQQEASILSQLCAYISFELRALWEMMRSDIIYLRYSPKELPATLLSLPLALIKTVYWEHNTLLENELEVIGRKKEQRRVRQILHSSRRFNISHIAVTQEIKRHLHNYNLKDEQVLYIQNGYSEKEIDPAKVNSLTLENLDTLKQQVKRLAVFVGSGKSNKWHGVETIISLTQDHPDLGLIIIGDYPENEKHPNVYFTGSLSVDTIYKIYDHCDFAFGSFNLAINQMQEACPLKVREYLWSGLPVIVNYRDSARDFDCLRPYIINLAERPDGVAECMRNSVDKSDIRAHAKSCLSWESLLAII